MVPLYNFSRWYQNFHWPFFTSFREILGEMVKNNALTSVITCFRRSWLAFAPDSHLKFLQLCTTLYNLIPGSISFCTSFTHVCTWHQPGNTAPQPCLPTQNRQSTHMNQNGKNGPKFKTTQNSQTFRMHYPDF